eukprot:CAMPEP_0184694552 /NCGR_PEP_ID=MMETSP0313-20130426/2459_1 /TAXON_ID=2792 /ORGANISM="Porphyridium aerugineum, Strain SAG 1380-2" /LENGTH=1200 /DNA_ID=CAMNT_0027152849 /DNA_START=449 /DNA_END=4051 /DNA_ORIENTATION=+
MARDEDEQDGLAGGMVTPASTPIPTPTLTLQPQSEPEPEGVVVGLEVEPEVEDIHLTNTSPENPSLEDGDIMHSGLDGAAPVQVNPALPLSPAWSSRHQHQIQTHDQDHNQDTGQEEYNDTNIYIASVIRTNPSTSIPITEQEPLSTSIHKHHGRKERIKVHHVRSRDDHDISITTAMQTQPEEKIGSQHERDLVYVSDSEYIGIASGSNSNSNTRSAVIVDISGAMRRRRRIKISQPPLHINTGGIKKHAKLSSIYQRDLHHHHFHHQQPGTQTDDTEHAGMHQPVTILPLEVETTIHSDVPEPSAAIQEFTEAAIHENQSNLEAEQAMQDIRQSHPRQSSPRMRATFSEGRLQSIVAEDGNPSMQTSVSFTDLSRQSVPEDVPMFLSGAPSIPSYQNTPSEPDSDDLLGDVATQSLEGSPWIHPSFSLSSSAADPASMQRATVFRPDRFIVEQVFSQTLPESFARSSRDAAGPAWESPSVLSAIPTSFEPGSQPLGMPSLYSSLLASSVFSPRRSAESTLLAEPIHTDGDSPRPMQDTASSSVTHATTSIIPPQPVVASIALTSHDIVHSEVLAERSPPGNTTYQQNIVTSVDATGPGTWGNMESGTSYPYAVSIEEPATIPPIPQESLEELFKRVAVTEPEAFGQVSVFPPSLAESISDRNRVHMSITPRDSHYSARSVRDDILLFGEHDDDSVITLSPPAEAQELETSFERESSLRKIFPVFDQFNTQISDYIKKRDAVSEAINEILGDRPGTTSAQDALEQEPIQLSNPLVPRLLPWSSLISSEGLGVAERLEKLKYEERYDPIQESYQHYHMYPQHFSTSAIETASVTQSHSSSRSSLRLPSLNSSSFNSLKDADDTLFKELMRTRAVSKPTWEIQRDVEQTGISEQPLNKERSDIDDIVSWRGDRSRPSNTLRDDFKPDFQTRTYFLGKFVDEVKNPVAEPVPNIRSITDVLPYPKNVAMGETNTENESTDMKDKAHGKGRLVSGALTTDQCSDGSEVAENDGIPICGYNNYRITMAAYFREKDYLVKRTPVLIRKVYDDTLESADSSQAKMSGISETMESKLMHGQISAALEPVIQTQNDPKTSPSPSPSPSPLINVPTSFDQGYAERKPFQASLVYDIGRDGHLVPWRESEHPTREVMGLGLPESKILLDPVNRNVLQTEYPLPIPMMSVPLLSDFRGLVPNFSAQSKADK